MKEGQVIWTGHVPKHERGGGMINALAIEAECTVGEPSYVANSAVEETRALQFLPHGLYAPLVVT